MAELLLACRGYDKQFECRHTIYNSGFRIVTRAIYLDNSDKHYHRIHIQIHVSEGCNQAVILEIRLDFYALVKNNLCTM